MKTLLTLILLCSCAVALAEPVKDIQLVSGEKIANASLVKADAAFATFQNEVSLLRVPLEQLLPADLDFFSISYNPDHARAAIQEQKEKSRAAQQQARVAASAIEMEFTIKQIVKGGALGTGRSKKENHDQIIAEENAAHAQLPRWTAISPNYGRAWNYHRDIFLEGDFSGKVDGETWSGQVWRDGTFNYTTVTGAARTIEKWRTSFPENK